MRSVTVTLHVAVLPPSAVVAVMIAVPSAIPVTLPVLSTVATEVSLLLQATFLLVAFAGVTVAVSCVVLPVSTVADVLSSEIPVTPTMLTVISHVAV